MDQHPPDVIARGFHTDSRGHACNFCDTRFVTGVIYEQGELLVDAQRAAHEHVRDVHGGAFEALLALGRKVHGLSDVQRDLLQLFHQGLSDKQIAARLGGRSLSTVRNHRFQLRRKHREAKVFVALMDLLEARSDTPTDPVEYHPGLPVSDDRVRVTHAQAEVLLDRYFVDKERTRLDRFPRKEKHKLVILRHLVEFLDRDRRYTERELNAVLGTVFDDWAVLRRWLVDYRFLARERDGSAYWRVDA